MKINIRFLKVVVFAVLICNYSFATNYTWKGGTSTEWGTASNWAPNGVPDSLDNVTIDTVNAIVLTSDRKAATLTLTSGSIDLDGYSLTIKGNATFNGGQVLGESLLTIRGGTSTFGGTTFDVYVDAIVNTLKFNGGTFNYQCTFEATTTVPGTSDGGSVFNDAVTIIRSYTGAGLMNLASVTGNTFNSDVLFVNHGSGGLAVSNVDTTYFGGAISLENTSSGGISFGSASGGTNIQTSNKSIEFTTFNAGTLTLRNFTIPGTAYTDSLYLTGTAILNLIDVSLTRTNIRINAPSVLLKNSTLNGTTTILNTASVNATWDGGNTFNGNTSITNTGNAILRLDNSNANTFNGNLTLNTSLNEIKLAMSGNTQVTGNLTALHSQVNFISGSGVVVLSGSSQQDVSVLSAFKNFKVDKTSQVVFNSPVTVSGVLTFARGRIMTTSTNLLTVSATGSVTGANDTSFVDGPVKKIGNTAFTFPVGSGMFYRPLSISSPTGSTDAYLAQFIDDTLDVHPYTADTTLGSIFRNRYWKLNRTNGTTNVYVSLSWNPNAGITDTSLLKIASWNGTKWKDAGRSSVTGNHLNGTLQTSAVSTTYSEFTLAYNKAAHTIFSCTSGSPDYNADSSLIAYYNFDLTAGKQYPCSLTAATTARSYPVLSPNENIITSYLTVPVGNGYLVNDSRAYLNSEVKGPSFNFGVSGNEVLGVEFTFKLSEDVTAQEQLRVFEIGTKDKFYFAIDSTKLIFKTSVDDPSNAGNDYLKSDEFIVLLDSTGRESWDYYHDNNWHHIFLRYDARTGNVKKEIWVDGLLQEGFYRENITGFSMSDITGTWKNIYGGPQISLFGSLTYPFKKFLGSIDNIAFYNDNVCDHQVVQHYENAVLDEIHYCFDSTGTPCSFYTSFFVNSTGLDIYNKDYDRLKIKVVSDGFSSLDTSGTRKEINFLKPIPPDKKNVTVNLFFDGATDTTKILFDADFYSSISDVMTMDGATESYLDSNFFYVRNMNELVLADENHSVKEVTIIPVKVILKDGLLMSPDSDGNYDRFIITGLSDTTEFSLTIYDSFKEEVFSTSNFYASNWDGTDPLTSEKVPVGTYSYVIGIKNKKIRGQFLVEY